MGKLNWVMHKQHHNERFGHVNADTMKLLHETMTILKRNLNEHLFPGLSIKQIEDKFKNYCSKFNV